MTSDDEDDVDDVDEDDFDRYGRSDYDSRRYTLKSTKWLQFIFPQEPIIEYLTSNVTLLKWMIAEGELMMILMMLMNCVRGHTIHPFINI